METQKNIFVFYLFIYFFLRGNQQWWPQQKPQKCEKGPWCRHLKTLLPFEVCYNHSYAWTNAKYNLQLSICNVLAKYLCLCTHVKYVFMAYEFVRRTLQGLTGFISVSNCDRMQYKRCHSPEMNHSLLGNSKMFSPNSFCNALKLDTVKTLTLPVGYWQNIFL